MISVSPKEAGYVRNPSQCPECGSNDLYSQGGINARGGYGADLLPGASGVFSTAKMRAVVCKGCGLVRFYADADALKRIGRDHGWNKVQ
jgi:predicted nucleic-acid-binding Zn-ribbon protein